MAYLSHLDQGLINLDQNTEVFITFVSNVASPWNYFSVLSSYIPWTSENINPLAFLQAWDFFVCFLYNYDDMKKMKKTGWKIKVFAFSI